MEKQEIINKIKQILENYPTDSHLRIESIIKAELKEIIISNHAQLNYCSCGYPICITTEGHRQVINELVKNEVDFRSYREFLYCPNCDKLLETVQH